MPAGWQGKRTDPLEAWGFWGSHCLPLARRSQFASSVGPGRSGRSKKTVHVLIVVSNCANTGTGAGGSTPNLKGTEGACESPIEPADVGTEEDLVADGHREREVDDLRGSRGDDGPGDARDNLVRPLKEVD